MKKRWYSRLLALILCAAQMLPLAAPVRSYAATDGSFGESVPAGRGDNGTARAIWHSMRKELRFPGENGLTGETEEGESEHEDHRCAPASV